MDALILVNAITNLEDNHVDFANGFLERGFDVSYGLINTLAAHGSKVFCAVAPVIARVDRGIPLGRPTTHQSVEHYDIVWVMNQPHPSLARDVWQLLWLLARRCKFVNSVEAMVFLNTKNTLGYLVPQEHLVETHVANDFGQLWNIYDDYRDERWIVKPPNSGCGTDVYLLEPSGRNARTILESMTGNTATSAEIADANLLGLQNRYCILQKYALEAARGEKGVLIAGGMVLTQYGRYPAAGEHRSNFTQGGRLVPATLTPVEHELCTELGQRLHTHGVNYASIDLAYPHVLEFNIVNPGGIYDILQLTGTDYTPVAIDHIVKAVTEA